MKGRRIQAVAVNAVLAVAALLTVAPLLWMLAASFMRSGEASSFPPPLWPVSTISWR